MFSFHLWSASSLFWRLVHVTSLCFCIAVVAGIICDPAYKVAEVIQSFIFLSPSIFISLLFLSYLMNLVTFDISGIGEWP